MMIMRHRKTRTRRTALTAGVVAASLVLGAGLFAAPSAQAGTPGVGMGGITGEGQRPLSGGQRADLLGVARDTWRFFSDDVDPKTHLPLDNLGPGTTKGAYTSAANIGMYLQAVIAASDLGIIDHGKERALLSATLQTVGTMQRSHGFLLQWYDTSTAQPVLNPGGPECSAQAAPAQDNCSFLSAVDNGLYATGLIMVRSAVPSLRREANALIQPMDFSIFYDSRAQTACNTNASIEGNQPTGQMYGGYYVGQGPAGYHNGAIYSDPRIAMYVGMGLKQMPGDVWWRTWRTLPPQRCSTDPDFSWQGQQPGGQWESITDPQSGKVFDVWEGHYTYPGTSMTYLPTWGGGMFEAEMIDQMVPETTWGTRSFGLADVRTAQVQEKYATQVLHYPVWGLSPSSTADDTGGYGTYGVEGLKLPVGQQLSQCTTCGTEDVVTPHASFIALNVLPQDAYANIQRLRALYPGLYTSDGGFYDAVNPTTGQIGHRRLVLDQSMIMMALDNALNNGEMRAHFAADPVSWAARTYLSAETMTLG